MNWKKYLILTVAVASLCFTSCSGNKTICVTNCGGGNATVNVTLYDTPPTGVSLLSFSLPIVGITLTPSTGSDVSIYAPTTILPTELTRLQTDSVALVNSASVAAGTYTGMKITVAASTGVFINSSGSTISWTGGSCATGHVCNLPNGGATTITVPLSVTLSNNVTQWIGLDVNLNNAIVTTGGIAVDFTQSNVFTATTTVRTGFATGGVDSVEDFIGKVTAVSNSSITVQNSITSQSITAAITSTTEVDAVNSTYSGCTNTAAACVTTGSIVSMDALLMNTGTYNATEIDVLDQVAVDEVEGVIYPTTTAGVFGMILADKTSASGSAILGASTTTYGTGVLLTVGSAVNCTIDTKTLSPVVNVGTIIGFGSSADLIAGQVVRAQVSNITSDTAGIHAIASNVVLRASRISGSIAGLAGNSFSLSGIPTYINTYNTSLSTTPLVNTSITATLFDGVTGTGDANFAVGKTAAIRTMFLNPTKTVTPFVAFKVRVP